MVAVTPLQTITATKIANPSIQAVSGWSDVVAIKNRYYNEHSIMMLANAATISILSVSSSKASISNRNQPNYNQF